MAKRQTPATPTATSGRWFDRHPERAVILLGGVIGLILVLRSFNAVFYPILFNEDGTKMVAYFTNNPQASSVFRNYAGYVALLPNFFGWLAVRLLPLPWTPYALVWISVLFATVAQTLFALPRFRVVMPDDRARMLLCLLLALFPLGNHALVTNLTFSIWNLFIIALLLTVAPLPRSRRGLVLQGILVGLAVCSHPYSILFIPLCLGVLYFRRSPADRWFHGGIIVLAVAYAFFGFQPDKVEPSFGLAMIPATLEAIAQRVVFEPVLGNNLRMILRDLGRITATNLLALVVTAGAVGLIAAAWKKEGLRNRIPVLLVFGFLAVAVTGATLVGRTGMYEDFLALAWGQRYFVPGQLLFLFLIVSNLMVLVRWAELGRVTRAAAVVLLLAYAGYLNLEHAPYFATSREQSRVTIQFLRDAEVGLRFGVAPGGARRMVLHRGQPWDIEIDLTVPSR